MTDLGKLKGWSGYENRMTKPFIYTAFHLNMAFSSIEEADRATVVKRCYWPLLELAETGFPIGIEATSYSLRTIQDIDPVWVDKLRQLIASGQVELIGSGYTQMIAPLVPPDVTRWNLKLGLEDYESILDVRPTIALLNEQAYAPGLVPLYLEAGFEAIMMDWAEPSSHNPRWDQSFSKSPQLVEGVEDNLIPVIWSDAISFQKFQRYAHGEIEADEYFEFLSLQLDGNAQAFPIYTSDAEIFDYRPGRFTHEADQGAAISEYERIRLLFEALKNSDDVELVLPSAALSCLDADSCPIRLETAAAPIPVKKQRKYNIMRWAVTGRNDLQLNTHCWRIYEDLKQNNAGKEQWRDLCGLWASDFRTHITDKRWDKLRAGLPSCANIPSINLIGPDEGTTRLPDTIRFREERRFLVIETGAYHLVLNTHRGLAIQAFGLGAYEVDYAGAPAANALMGTLAHGFYSDIAFGADFYTGHFVLEPAASHKVTDLQKVQPQVRWHAQKQNLVVSATVKTPLGDIEKHIVFSPKTGAVKLEYEGIELPQIGNLRCGHVTLNPRAFEAESLYFKTHNGGDKPDEHRLWDNGLVPVDHGAPVSRLVSSTTGLGMTGDVLELGDKNHYVLLSAERQHIASAGLITAKPVDDTFFVRAALSVQELDETVKQDHAFLPDIVGPVIMSMTLSIGKHI